MDWNLPSLTQTWANFLTALRSRDESNAKMDYTGDSNIPDGTVRWSATNKRFETWNATTSTWGVLASSYSINVDQVDSEHASDFASAKGGTGNRQAKDADTVDGVHLPGSIANVLTNHTKAVHDALNIDAETLDGLNSSQFLRSDTSDTMSGSMTMTGNLTVNGEIVSGKHQISANENALELHASTINSAYLAFFSNSANSSIRTGYVGNGSVSSYNVFVNADQDGADIILSPGSGGKAMVGAAEVWHSGNADSAPGLSFKKTQTGYAQLPGGITMQWGRIANGANDPTVTFPIAFPNECSSVTASHINSGPTNDAPCPSNITKTSFVLNNGGTLPCTWIAVGF